MIHHSLLMDLPFSVSQVSQSSIVDNSDDSIRLRNKYSLAIDLVKVLVQKSRLRESQQHRLNHPFVCAN